MVLKYVFSGVKKQLRPFSFIHDSEITSSDVHTNEKIIVSFVSNSLLLL